MAENQESNPQAQGPQFALQRIYLKDLSFESPESPVVFTQEWKPEVNMDLNTKNKKLNDEQYEVVLSITLTIKNGDKVAFLVEVQQAGVFLVQNFEGSKIGQMLGAFCPNILFPYARAAVDDVITRGSFPALMLAPVNFDAVYAQAVKKEAAKQTEEQGSEGEPTTH